MYGPKFSGNMGNKGQEPQIPEKLVIREAGQGDRLCQPLGQEREEQLGVRVLVKILKLPEVY